MVYRGIHSRVSGFSRDDVVVNFTSVNDILLLRYHRIKGLGLESTLIEEN
ncbi:hypothetical protein Plhal304r1_c004g0017231 [Plasmopara halstedii]